MNDENIQHDVITFDSSDAMVNWLRERREELDSRVIPPVQQAITWGDSAIRFYGDLVIFVRIISRDDLAAEDRDTRENIEANERRNSLYSMSYSRVAPYGDWGHQHRSVLWPIEERVFLMASSCGWDPEQMPDWAQERIAFAYHGFVDYLS